MLYVKRGKSRRKIHDDMLDKFLERGWVLYGNDGAGADKIKDEILTIDWSKKEPSRRKSRTQLDDN